MKSMYSHATGDAAAFGFSWRENGTSRNVQVMKGRGAYLLGRFDIDRRGLPKRGRSHKDVVSDLNAVLPQQISPR
jgi:hypothetical protein